MESKRMGEEGAVPVRRSRFFKHGDNWFFTTRECSIIGPYNTFQDALFGCRKFIAQIQSIRQYHESEQCA